MNEALLEDLKRLLEFRSVLGEAEPDAPFGREIKNTLNFALDLGRKMGFKAVNTDDCAGYIEYGEGEEMIAVLCHLDVVPAGSGWSCEPFALTIKDGKMYGRGIMDDKGPFMMCLYAMKEIKEQGLKTKRRIRIILGTDEESGCRDMEKYCESEEIPVMAFTPDADFPVIYSEKSISVVKISAELCDVPECWKVEYAKAGDVVNKVPDFAEIEFSNGENKKVFRTFDGVSAHGSTPEQGKNAIDIIVGEILDSGFIEVLEPNVKAMLRFYEKHLMDDTGGISMNFNGDKFETGLPTVNAGMLETEQGRGIRKLTLKLDVRIPAEKNHEDYLKKIENICDKSGLEFSVERSKDGLLIDRESELVKILSDVYGSETGEEANPIAIGGGTYAKKLPNTVAFGPLFPGRKDTIHQADECFEIDDFIKCKKIYKKAMLELAALV